MIHKYLFWQKLIRRQCQVVLSVLLSVAQKNYECNKQANNLAVIYKILEQDWA